MTVSVITGLGECLGYSLRLVSGRLADVTGKFWPITIIGYIIQMASVPALALTDSWPTAAALIILERVGKAIRNPPRDVMLSHAGMRIGGYGWAFGIHEAFDQSGAMVGPLLVAYFLAHRGSYREAFAVLLVPAVLNLVFVAIARWSYPRPGDLQEEAPQKHNAELPRAYWVYLLGAALVAAGFADYPLIAFHFNQTKLCSPEWIAIFYAVAMAVGGSGSLAFGRLFDRFGFPVLVALTLLSALFAPLVFLGDFWVSLIGVAVWGLGMGVHEAVIPAAVAPMVPVQRCGSAFGLFTAVYGVSWLLGSAVIGFLYDYLQAGTIAFCVVMELAAVPIFIWVGFRRANASA